MGRIGRGGLARAGGVGGLLLLGLVLLVLAGCKRSETGQLPAVSGEAIQAQRRQIEGFGLVRAWPDQTGDGLAIALEFSQPLVGTQDFDRLLTFAEPPAEPSGWTLDEGGTVLRYPHVTADRTYTVRISGELTAADGTRLPAPLEEKVYTGDLDPLVGFASQGSVLPARESRGLPVVSVNVDEVDVEFLRVHEASLPKFFSEYQRGGQRGSWELESRWDGREPLSKLAEPVYVNRFVLGGKRNERLLTYLPLQDIPELQPPGLYFAVMKRAGSFSDQMQTAFFTVSDLGLHARAYKDQLFVHAASLRDGAPIANAELRVLDARGETIYRASTDRNGNTLADYTIDTAHVLVARRGNDVAMLPFNQPALDLSEFAVSGPPATSFDVFAWSGRDLYRPGETVRVSALLRDGDGRLLPVRDGRAQVLFVRLRQPDGKPFFETRLQPGALGYYSFEATVPSDAPTGRWRVEFRTDPSSREAVQGMALRIEEFLPERMKLELDAVDALLRPGQPLRLQVDGAYLYGAPAAGNRFTARLALAVDQHPVEGMPGWFFGDPTVQLPKDARDVVETTLDAQGRLREDIALPEEVKATTPVAVVVSGSLYESGGRSVNRTLRRVLWPASSLVAIRPLFDPDDGPDANSSPRFELLRVGEDGKPRPASGLQVTLVREHRDYHWRHDDQGGWEYEYASRFENVATRGIDVGTSPARVDFPVEWGEYRIDVRDPETGLVTRYPFVAGWSWGDGNRGLDARPDKVKLALDRTAYRAGDRMKVTLTPPHPGRGLLIVESDRPLYVQGIDARAGSSFEIPVTEDWERHDVYVTALVFRGGSAASAITPARAVGVAYVPMDRRDRRVAVGLNVPARITPEGPLQVVLSAPQLAGKEAYATVSAVDVGILNITRYPVPDAFAYFFAQRRLGVDAWDVYGRVIESYEGGTARPRFGGDMPLAAMPQARRPTARVQTVDLFAGPVRLDASGNAKVLLDVPDFNGSLRVSALVYSADGYGSRAAETVARAPVVAEASMPRVLAPGDRATVTLDLANFTGRAGRFDVRVGGIGPLQVGEGSRRVELPVDGRTTLSFPLAATTGYEVAQVRVRVDGNGARVDRRYDLPVRPAWPAILRTRSQVLESPAPVTLDRSLAQGLMAGSVLARFSLSALPPIPFASAIRGALDYPYGCAEQVASKGYAALELDPATAAMLGIGDVDAERRRQYVESAFGRLAGMQARSGHFSMWGGNGDVEPALTPYIAEFLLDAREAGFNVPDQVLQRALERMGEDLLAGDPQFYGQPHREALRFAYQAHAGYVLARVNRAPLGTLRALYDNDRDKALTALSLAQLGLALSLQGDRSRGERALAEAFARRELRPRDLWDYGSNVRDLALMIALTHERGFAQPQWDARVVGLGRDIDARRVEGRLYLSTQEQMALARLGRALGVAQGKQVSGTLVAAGASQPVAPARIVSRAFDAAALAAGVRFDPVGQPPLYLGIDVAGVPDTAPAPDRRTVQVERALFTTQGQPWTPGPLREGEALIVALSLTPDVAMPNALVTDLLPAGLEIENFDLGDEKQWAEVVIQGIAVRDRGSAATLRHEEYRDDRYVAALDLQAGATARLFYLVRAVTPGTYTVPPPMVEDMYRPGLRGVGRAVPATVTVVQP